MATVLDIIKGISQAAANAYDGSHDGRYTNDGEEKKMGLRREEGDPGLETRQIDGFKVKFHGDKLNILYHAEIKLKETHDKNRFENTVTANINDVANYLKREYKKVTGESLTLTKEGEAEIMVQHISNVRSTCQANCMYKIGGMNEVVAVDNVADGKEKLDKITKDWLAYNKNFEIGKGKNHAKNVTREKKQ
tara:strand:- start:31255 stop:31830 length:576 start_codon:yes stop_codon:yes gene_type:complete